MLLVEFDTSRSSASSRKTKKEKKNGTVTDTHLESFPYREERKKNTAAVKQWQANEQRLVKVKISVARKLQTVAPKYRNIKGAIRRGDSVESAEGPRQSGKQANEQRTLEIY